MHCGTATTEHENSVKNKFADFGKNGVYYDEKKIFDGNPFGGVCFKRLRTKRCSRGTTARRGNNIQGNVHRGE